MTNKLIWKGLIFLIIGFFICSCVLPSMAINDIEIRDSIQMVDNETEYWALIFAVGFYSIKTDVGTWDRPWMILNANLLKETLLDSPNWKEDHIHVVTAEEATGTRLIRELLWLIRKEDRNDFSFIYLTTHGSPLLGLNDKPIDLPPKDEEDGADEILLMYEGFEKPYAFIWDDLLNFFLSLLQSKGVCLVVDSCYSGGFDDDPMFKKTYLQDYTPVSFAKGLTEDLSGQNRVVLTSCREYESCHGPYFSTFFIDGIAGAGDFCGNNDGINSAEESFEYARYWVNLTLEHHIYVPTIHDCYPGEYPLTFSNSIG
jgi:hypothetical protein